MLVPKKNRLAVYSFLFKEGVIVTHKDLVMTPHPGTGVPQLHVVKLLQSLCSRGVVREKFNWQYLYYVLTDTGVTYLREYLHLSEDTVPTTHKKPVKKQPSTISRRYEEESSRGGRGGRGRGGRGGYRGPREFGSEGREGGRGGFGGRGRGRGVSSEE